MTDREADQYFEYYVSQIPIRIAYLQNFLDNNLLISFTYLRQLAYIIGLNLGNLQWIVTRVKPL